MTRSPREAIASTFARGLHPNGTDLWKELNLKHADRILARLAEGGFVVVPRKLTDEMLIRGARKEGAPPFHWYSQKTWESLLGMFD